MMIMYILYILFMQISQLHTCRAYTQVHTRDVTEAPPPVYTCVCLPCIVDVVLMVDILYDFTETPVSATSTRNMLISFCFFIVDVGVFVCCCAAIRRRRNCALCLYISAATVYMYKRCVLVQCT